MGTYESQPHYESPKAPLDPIGLIEQDFNAATLGSSSQGSADSNGQFLQKAPGRIEVMGIQDSLFVAEQDFGTTTLGNGIQGHKDKNGAYWSSPDDPGNDDDPGLIRTAPEGLAAIALRQI